MMGGLRLLHSHVCGGRAKAVKREKKRKIDGCQALCSTITLDIKDLSSCSASSTSLQFERRNRVVGGKRRSARGR